MAHAPTVNMESVFSCLQPVCVKLARHHTRQNVKDLSFAISTIDDHQLVELQDYVMFPLRLILKGSANTSSELYIDVVQCLYQVVSRIEIKQWNSMKDIFNSLCLLVSDPDGHISHESEELKLAVVECLTGLVLSARWDVRVQLYMLPFLPCLGHAVNVLLTLLSNESYQRLQTEAALCLLKLATGRSGDQNMNGRIGETLSSFLPGITMATTRVITADYKQSQRLTKAALAVWTRVVVVAMGDTYLSLPSKEEKESVSEGFEVDADLARKLEKLKVSRSEKWVEATAGKLGILINKIVNVATHPQWQVRQAMVAWAHSLISDCGRSMPDATRPALHVLVQLAADEYSSVASCSQEALEEVKTGLEASRGRHFVTLQIENLHDIATCLPRLMRSTDDEQKVANLTLFIGYIKLLGCDVRSVLHSAAHLQRISMTLLQVLELDLSHLDLIQEAPPGFQLLQPGSGDMCSTPRYYFKHFHQDAVYNQIILVCKLLGYYGDLDLLVDHFLEISRQGPLYRKEAFLILNHILLGAGGVGLKKVRLPNKRNEALLEFTVSTLLDEYLLPMNWDLITQAKSGNPVSDDLSIVPVHPDVSSLWERTSDILQMCLLLDGIAACAQVLHCGFREQLVDVLYPLMERLGDGTTALHTTAYNTSHQVAAACGYSDIQEMVCLNSDYLVNSISLRLRHIERHPRSAAVLRALLEHTTADILSLFEDIVHQVLAVLDEHYDSSAPLLMDVLHTLVKAIVKWHVTTNKSQTSVTGEEARPSPTTVTSPSSDDSNTVNTLESELASFLLDYHNTKVIAGGQPDMDVGTTPELDTEGSNDVMDVDNEAKKEIPHHIQVVKEILERCCHLMSAPEASLRLLVLRTVAQAFIAMQSEQNELLPMAHKIWQPFVQRFKDERPLVSLEAIRTLMVIGQTTGDFLWRRVSTEVLPPMADFLTTQAKLSTGSHRQYRHTLLSKLQVAVINTLSSVCSQIRVSGCVMYRVALSCLPYLSTKQPAHLQQVALSAFQHFLSCDVDTVWLVLFDAYCPHTLIPPDPRFSPLKGGPTGKNEYSDNISRLLDEIS